MEEGFEDWYDYEGARYHIMASPLTKKNGQKGWLIGWMSNSGSGGTCIWVAAEGGHVHKSYTAEKFGYWRVGKKDSAALSEYISNTPAFGRVGSK